ARVKDLDMATERAAAAADPMNIDAAFNVADLDLVGGHVEDAYNRLLRLFSAVGPDDKARVRERLVQLFDVVGASDPRTVKARAALTMALF
ncbi:tetratricopeptide repeat protein, partial [Rothia mucilaginosa]